MRTRRLRLEVGGIDVKTGWENAQLVINRYYANGRKEAVITIRSPYDARELRKAIAKIEAYWQEVIDRCK